MNTQLQPRPAELGVSREVDLAAGRLRYFESGPADGPVVVFVHGLLVNADLWQYVAPEVAAAGARCIAVDWPLGAHRIAVPDADLSPPGVADLIAEFLEVLGLEDVTLVANDTGGALTQILLTRHPERVGRVVLTPSDCFERFFPPVFAPLPLLARVPGLSRVMLQTMQLRALQRLPFTFGWLTKRPLPAASVTAWLAPGLTDKGVRRDLTRFVRAVHRRHTLAAAEHLAEFDRPVLLAWAEEDKLFPISLAHRLAAVFPDAEVVAIADSYTFVPLDQPAVLSRLLIARVLPDAAA